MGYTVTAKKYPLDDKFAEWGDSQYFTVTLEGSLRLHQMLTHLYVLIPVLDNDKHYWVGDDEVAKLLRHGEGWLATHPERDTIATRYLKHRRSLINEALAQLVDAEDPSTEETQDSYAQEEAQVEERISLNEQRLGSVLAVLKNSGSRRVLDLGCGEGKLLQGLLKERQFEEIVGMDVSHRALEIAKDRLNLDQARPITLGWRLRAAGRKRRSRF